MLNSGLMATLYAYPLWKDVALSYGPPVFVLVGLAVWTLIDRRWALYLFLGVIAVALCHYGFLVMVEGWRALLPALPDPTIHDPRWRIHFGGDLLALVTALLCLSAPAWRTWARRKAELDSQ